MRAVVIVVLLPFAQLLVEQPNVIADAVFVEELVELLVINAVRAFDLAIQPRRPGSDVHVADVQAFEVPVESRLELGPVVRLNHLHAKPNRIAVC